MATKVTYKGLKILLSDSNIHIENSYKVSGRKDMEKVLKYLRKNYACNIILSNRDNASMINEWVSHNRLYRLSIAKEHTESVDLNYPQKLYEKIFYTIFGL